MLQDDAGVYLREGLRGGWQESSLDCDDYCTRPRRSCDRGATENGNGLLRQYSLKIIPLHEVMPRRRGLPQ